METLCGVAYGEVSANRVNSCNAYGAVNGTIELAILKLWHGLYCPNGCWSGAAARSR